MASCFLSSASTPCSVSLVARSQSALNRRMLNSASRTVQFLCKKKPPSERVREAGKKQLRPSRSLKCTWVLVSRKRVEVYVALEVGLLQPAHELKRHERVHRPEHEAILGSQPRRAVVELHACKTTQIQGACMCSRRSAYLVCVCVRARVEKERERETVEFAPGADHSAALCRVFSRHEAVPHVESQPHVGPVNLVD